MTTPLEDLQKEYQDYAFIVSHDIFAYFRRISGFSQLLLDSLPELNDTQKEYKQYIQESMDEAEQALEALLQFSRLNTDAKDFKHYRVKDIIDEALNKLSIKTQQSRCEINVSHSDKGIYGDRKLLVMALYHLVDNAIKFQPVEQKALIDVNVSAKDDKVIFTITDNGIGIPSDQTDRAMTILQRLNASKYEGRGVGLAYARKIAHIHNGNLKIESVDGDKGTKIVLEIMQE